MPLIELTQDNFDEVVSNNEIVLVDFWAQWCAPCLAFASTYESLAEQYPDLVFGKVNTEEQSELAADFNVRSIPMLMVMKSKVVVFSESGTMPENALRELIEQAVKLDMTEVMQQIADAEKTEH